MCDCGLDQYAQLEKSGELREQVAGSRNFLSV